MDAIDDKNYFLVLIPTMDCNFKCWYCVQNHIPSQMSIEVIEHVKNHIDYIIKEEKISSLHIEWFGGEPFMYLNEVIKPISEYAIEQCRHVDIPFYNTATTNAYYLTEDNIGLIEKLKLSRFQITLDGVAEIHDKVKFCSGCQSAFAHALVNINNILSKLPNVNIILRINYTGTNLDIGIVNQINQYISRENRVRISILMRKVWQEKNNHSRVKLLNQILNLFLQSGYKCSDFYLSRNFIPCYACKEFYAAINFNGSVFKCTATADLMTETPPGKLRANGVIMYDNVFKSEYCGDHLSKRRCIKCKHLPICMGVCPSGYDKPNNFCSMQLSDETVEELILNHIKTNQPNTH